MCLRANLTLVCYSETDIDVGRLRQTCECATQLLRYWESMKIRLPVKSLPLGLARSDLPKDAMTNNNSQQTGGFQGLANIQTQTATKRGQGLLVLLHSLSRNTLVHILVYISFNLAAAWPAPSKRHSAARVCCDVSNMPIWRRLTVYLTESPELRPGAEGSVNHAGFPIRGIRDVLAWGGVTSLGGEAPVMNLVS